MRSNLTSAAEVVNWNRRILGLLGSWPEESRNVRFSVFLSYLIIHVTLEYAYLYQNIKHLDGVVASMTDNIPFTVVLLKAVWFRKKHNLLCKIIRKMKRNLAIGDYRNTEEVEIFLRYNTIAKNFVRVVVPLVFLCAIVYFAKPMFIQLTKLGGNDSNDTSIYALPYRVYLFYDVTDVRAYLLTYALQTPLVPIATFGYTGTDCLLVTLTFHVCSELSILASRIKNLNCDSPKSHKAIQILINRHVELIQMARMIEDIFNVLLLGQLFGATFLTCFLGYNVLANTGDARATELLNFSLYGFVVVVLLYAYCYVGDCLIHEVNPQFYHSCQLQSLKVRDAFFQCSWYELPVKNSISLVTCIMQSQKPLHLTAGKFYVFSLPTFADVIKTSSAYLSVLRNFL